jgi:hypothetical protein
MKTTAWKVLALVLLSVGARAQQSASSVPPAAPPVAPAQRSATELENLVARIALYPDPLIATILPASTYPLEIVQAARFVADTNNLPKLDAQPWDDNVKAVASMPAVIKMMNDDLTWTIALGEIFLAQEKELFDAIQRLRAKAQTAGTLRTTAQQTVVVTNTVVEKIVEQQVTVVTNTVVQITPSSSEVVYVPTYNPAYVYAPPPGYVYDPYAPLVAFGAGIAVGAIIWNDCDWHHGGVYVGHHGTVVWTSGDTHHPDGGHSPPPPGNRPPPAGNRPPPGVRPQPRPDAPQKWQPDQNRLRASSTLGTAGTARTLEARGWTSGGARPATLPGTGSVAARPSTGNVAARPATGTVAARPVPSYSGAGSSSRASGSGSRGSAFGGLDSGSSARASSNRGYSSRSGGGSRGGSRGGGGRGGGRGR